MSDIIYSGLFYKRNRVEMVLTALIMSIVPLGLGKNRTSIKGANRLVDTMRYLS